MLNKTKLTEILKNESRIVALKARENLKSDFKEIVSEVGAVDLARENLSIPQNEKYQSLKESVIYTAKNFYNSVDSFLKDNYKTNPLITPKVKTSSWANKNDLCDNSAFDYRIALRKDVKVFEDEILSIDTLLKRLELPSERNILAEKRSFEESFYNFYKHVDLEFRKEEK